MSWESIRQNLPWNPSKVREIINPFAEHISDGIFKAVHSNWDLNIAAPQGQTYQNIQDENYDTQSMGKFLEDFLSEKRPHVLAVVLGQTGTGKSHLIHWMRIHLPKNDKSEIIVVKKSNTSLRNIVRMIIDRLPETSKKQNFLDAFNSTIGEELSVSMRRSRLTSEIALAIEGDEIPENATKRQAEIQEHLHYLFHDNSLKNKYFLKDESIITQIVDHIFEQSKSTNRPDNALKFLDEHLSFGGEDFAKASQEAINALFFLNQKEDREYALQVINRNLDKAIQKTLSFTDDRIEELLGELRRDLKLQGKELILLVEEFARLQGIDRALLQAVTTQADVDQCKMRTAIAVTTGFFETVAATAYTRTTHIVNMDKSAGLVDDEKDNYDTIVSFVARYLNAVKLGLEKITEWSDTSEPGDTPPSACDALDEEDRNLLHSTFGQVDGYGLYPFTKKAIVNLAYAIDETFDRKHFNPRVIQNNLLVRVLDRESDTISNSEFPSYSFYESIGKLKKLKTVNESKLKSLNEDASTRWIPFLNVYSGSPEIEILDQNLFQALSIPGIPDTAGGITGGGEDPPPPPPPPPPESEDIGKIEKWSSNKASDTLDQAITQKLRDRIYFAIIQDIDWDMIGYATSDFSGVGASTKSDKFQPRSISFDRQETQADKTQRYQIKIPGELELSKVSSALQGLIQVDKEKNDWSFKDGSIMLSNFLDCLDYWKKSLVKQLQNRTTPNDKWNERVASIEILAIGSAIAHGYVSDEKYNDIINKCFSKLPINQTPNISKEINQLYTLISKDWTQLREQVLSLISSTKGGSKGPMIFLSKIKPVLNDLINNKWLPTQIPIETDKSSLATLYKKIKDQLESAVEKEINDRKLWQKKFEEAFGKIVENTDEGSSEDKDEFKSQLEKVIENVVDLGINTESYKDQVMQQKDLLSFHDLETMYRVNKIIVNKENHTNAIPFFGCGIGNGLSTADRYIDTLSKFIEIVDQKLDNKVRQSGSEEIIDLTNNITDHLSSINKITKTI